jgi:hypothetical protein
MMVVMMCAADCEQCERDKKESESLLSQNDQDRGVHTRPDHFHAEMVTDFS